MGLLREAFDLTTLPYIKACTMAAMERRNTKYDYARNMSGRYASPPETRDHSLGRPRWDASLRGVNADRGL